MQREEAARAEESSSVHTVNAAAVVLAAAARSSDGLRPHHHLHGHDHDPAAAAAATKKRWWSRLSATLCFRPPHAHAHAHPRRVIAADGDTPPRPTTAATRTASASAYVHQAPPAQPVFAFAAPPSSPASSLFQSGAPSPVLLDLHGTAGSSPSMFAVGPYARGPQQLVSPPVLYSALTTEPSTAPRTPPATTGPSSPEVPFARFVDDGGHELLFHHAAYQLRLQGSPATPLVSPGPEPGSPSSPRLFRKVHRRSEQGSLLDGHVPVASSFEGADARDIDDDDDEVPDSAGEFVFGNADGRGAAPEEDVDGKNWHFFPMAMAEQHVSPTRQEAN